MYTCYFGMGGKTDQLYLAITTSYQILYKSLTKTNRATPRNWACYSRPRRGTDPLWQWHTLSFMALTTFPLYTKCRFKTIVSDFESPKRKSPIYVEYLRSANCKAHSRLALLLVPDPFYVIVSYLVAIKKSKPGWILQVSLRDDMISQK